MSLALIRDYLAAFNRADFAGMLALLTDDVAHDINQGGREVGRDAFARFLERMDECYREQLSDIVLMPSADGSRVAAEFTVSGEYKMTDPGFPEAHGQRYHLPAGAFFEVRGERIARVTMHYNVRDWLQQIGA